MKPKHIEMPPSFEGQELSPAQLNAMRVDMKHTVLTPDLLEKMVESKPKPTT